MEPAGVHLSAKLPLQWEARNAFTPEELAEWMHGNTVTLQALAQLESAAKASETDEETDTRLARLEAKVDLTLILVGELLRRQTPLPIETLTVLSGDSVEWHATESLATQTMGVVALYLSPRLPWPLMLPVEIIGSQDGMVRARLTHMSEDAQEWLDRTLFRHHRRAVHAKAK